MFNTEIYAAALARMVDLMRQPDAKEQQKAALRALVALSGSTSATIRCYDGVLSVDAVEIDPALPHVGGFAARMAAHNIAEIAIGRGADAAELLALMRGLAEGPYGVPQVKERLREARSQHIMVLLSNEDEPAGDDDGVGKLFEESPAEAPRRSGGNARKRRDTATDALAAWDALHASGNSNSMMKEIDLGFRVEPEIPAPAVPAPPPVEEALPELPIAADTPLGEALMRVALRPHDADVLDRLSRFTEVALAAVAAGEGGEVLKALAMLAALSQGAPEGTPLNSYRITMRRVLTRESLLTLAPIMKDPAFAEATAVVLPLAGADAMDVFLTMLIDAENIRERRAWMNVLRNMPQGREQIPHLLTHHQWFVVRNIAELVGEMRLEMAIPGLGKLLQHADQRVRRTAAIALVKIGTPPAMEPLRNALRAGGAPELRGTIASLLGSSQAAAFGSALIALLDTEEDPEALKEICLALARMNTAESRGALDRAAKQGGLFNRRVKLAREAAEAALKKIPSG